MKISYAITVSVEIKEIKSLLLHLKAHIRPEDEIKILFDRSCKNGEVFSYLSKANQEDQVGVITGVFNKHFADWKNKLNSYCKGDFIFQIDADEIPSDSLIIALPKLLEQNNVDLIKVPRVNTLEGSPGVIQAYVKSQKWSQNEKGWINWPDFQDRIYRNSSNIQWKGKVHETITGFQSYSMLPYTDSRFALLHYKSIEKQIKQNQFYETI